MFNVISVTRGVGGVPISRKIALRNTWMAPLEELQKDTIELTWTVVRFSEDRHMINTRKWWEMHAYIIQMSSNFIIYYEIT